MDIKKPAEAEPKGPENTTLIPDPSAKAARTGRKSGRTKKAVSADEMVAATLSFDPEFARQLKTVTAATGESSSALVQRLVWPVVTKELRKLLEQMF